MSRPQNQHFIYREKNDTSYFGGAKVDGHSYYLYKGFSFEDSDYELLMMARHFPEKNEIRLYTVNDLPASKHGMFSSKSRIKTANRMRKVKESK